MTLSNSKWMLFALLITACGGDEVDNNATPECPDGTSYNPILATCSRISDNNDNNLPLVDMGDTSGEDAGGDASDLATMPELGCQTDNDGDGAIAMECGGDDCDDNDDRRSPTIGERCDEVDNNCDEVLNEGLTCSILAHSDSRLYRVDFFAGTYEDLGPAVEGLYDIDTHPDGTTYGIAGDKLHVFDEVAGDWTERPGNLSFSATPNGFCIDNEGNAFITGGDTLGSVDLASGTSTAIGTFGTVESSGDCVVNKGNQLFMTSSHTTLDSFASIDGDTAQTRIIGETGYDAIWGLTAAYSRVFGLTFEGDVVEIDVRTGATTLIASFPEISFYGAASTPLR